MVDPRSRELLCLLEGGHAGGITHVSPRPWAGTMLLSACACSGVWGCFAKEPRPTR